MIDSDLEELKVEVLQKPSMGSLDEFPHLPQDTNIHGTRENILADQLKLPSTGTNECDDTKENKEPKDQSRPTPSTRKLKSKKKAVPKGFKVSRKQKTKTDKPQAIFTSHARESNNDSNEVSIQI